MFKNLVIQSSDQDGDVKNIASFTEGLVSVGRDEDNGLIVPQSSVSRRHGCLLKAGTQWIYYDNNSTNGSWINSNRVYKDRIFLLRAGDILQVSDNILRLASSEDVDLNSVLPSILVFHENKFVFEVDFRGEEDEFYLCSCDGECNIAKVKDDSAVVHFRYSSGNITFDPLPNAEYVSINEIPQKGQTILKDRDQLKVKDFYVVVNDPGSTIINQVGINQVSIESISDSKESVDNSSVDNSFSEDVGGSKLGGHKEGQPFGWEENVDNLPEDRSKIIVDHKNIYDTYSISNSDIELDLGDTVNNLGKSLRFHSAEAIAEERNEDYNIDPLRLFWFISFFVVGVLILLYFMNADSF